jgi:hypothetical protein
VSAFSPSAGLYLQEGFAMHCPKKHLMKKILLVSLLFLSITNIRAQQQNTPGRLVISKDNRYLEYEDGTPFFWLGDTGWFLFSHLTFDEIKKYLDNRVSKGFNVIQATLLGDFNIKSPTRAGYSRALKSAEPLIPDESYFKFVDSVVALCLEKKVYLALLTTWGDKVVKSAGNTVIFDSVNAFTYGKWLGERYQKFPNIIWIIGGDVPVVKDGINYIAVWRRMASGIREGTKGKCLITYHPNGYRSSSEWLHNESWLDFNMIQSSHGNRDVPTWTFVSNDRHLTPVKPTIDAEPNYEDHPVHPWPKWNADSGYFRDYDVRKQLYRSVFAGSIGVTYGHHAVWQFLSERDEVINYADRGWINALDRPGAFQAGYMRRLVESRSLKNRFPDSLIVTEGQGTTNQSHIEAYRGGENDFAMVYLPIGKTIKVNTSFIKSGKFVAWWFNPKDASVKKIGLYNVGQREFTPLSSGIENDWVLVLDDASKNFPTPGKR